MLLIPLYILTLIITPQNISKSYTQGNEQIDILDQVSATFLPGEKVAILGPSGSGKTTLLSIIAAFENPSHGEVLFGEQNIHDLSPEKLQHMRQEEIGFIFQSFELLSALTVRENAMLPLKISGKYSDKEARLKAENILKSVGLSHRMDFFPSKISGGESQRVAVARSLIHQPKYIFADEPTGNLDEKNSHTITELLLSSITSEQILVVITHDRSVAEKMDRIFYISNHALHEES